ncbi:MAG: hypothetical protein KC636_38805, partial [Myxococcales bacterium]|nr:hypothetical protein [Myxococcales bacterium]
LREQLAEEQRKAEERRKAEDDARRKGGEPDRARERKLGRTLQISGGVAVGVGAALLGVMGFGLARGRALDSEGETTKVMLGVNDPALEDIRDQGRTMNQLAWGAGISGGVLVAAGVSLLIVGSLQRARATAALPRLQVGRGLVGLSWSTRF